MYFCVRITLQSHWSVYHLFLSNFKNPLQRFFKELLHWENKVLYWETNEVLYVIICISSIMLSWCFLFLFIHALHVYQITLLHFRCSMLLLSQSYFFKVCCRTALIKLNLDKYIRTNTDTNISICEYQPEPPPPIPLISQIIN